MDRYVWLAAAVSAALLAAIAAYLLAHRKVTPEERERRRRHAVNARGRITDGVITEVLVVDNPAGSPSHLVHFTYELHGVTYAAAQDVAPLLGRIRHPERMGGPVSVKYLPGNPSNSIVVCEDWSGLR